jgi:NADH-quinone oxidoreductase subunit M
VLGLFPFHGWVVTFLGTPRSTIFLPIICIETAMLFFFRVYAPIITHHFSESTIPLVLPVIGLVYAALLFFGERRLKRIPGYLYMSHVSMMALSADDFGVMGMATSLLDGVNILLAILALLGVCALLTARFGVRGVLTPSGLGSRFPELAVCYLVCVLSLVGFPGTLGFIQEEIMLGEGLEHHAVLIGIIALALTLNGFSGFRLFARIFYGQPFEGRDTEIGLSLRERGVLFLILALIILNGLAPSFLISTLTDLAHEIPSM